MILRLESIKMFFIEEIFKKYRFLQSRTLFLYCYFFLYLCWLINPFFYLNLCLKNNLITFLQS